MLPLIINNSINDITQRKITSYYYIIVYISNTTGFLIKQIKPQYDDISVYQPSIGVDVVS